MDRGMLSDYRRAYSQWEDCAGSNIAHPLARLGQRMRDAMVAVDTTMTAVSGQLDAWPVTVAACHDDSEQCVHCAYPEHSAVVILLNGDPVCREHIWRALAGTLGVRDREVPDVGPVEVPDDFPVRPLADGEPAAARVTCGACGLSWDDAITTERTPTPAGRCPFEYFHRS